MLKRRLIPVLNILDGSIVRSEDFKVHQNIGNVINQASRYNEWEVDELIYLDIGRKGTYAAGRSDHKVNTYVEIDKIIEQISKVCFMPLAFGGGIKTLRDVDLRIRHGADKVIINTEAFHNPSLITEIADKYGSQAVIISIDYRMIDSKPRVFTRFASEDTGMSLYDWVKRCEDLGAGEIFINAIDRDGKANGYDLETIQNTCDLTKIPTICCGGAGVLEDFVEVFEETNVSAVAAGNIFHFTERAYPRAKKLLKEENINVR